VNYYPDPEQLASAWRQLADTANENGETPLFPLGLDSLYRNSWLNLLALNRIARQNLGPQHPTIVAGGEGWLWLFAMHVWRPGGGEYGHKVAADSRTKVARTPEGQSEGFDDAGRTVLYAGADSALYTATLNLAAQRRDSSALPPGLDWSTSLSASPGVEGADFELLPALVTEEVMSEPVAPGENAWLHKGERWASGLLALALLIAAFFG
jgi:hypothetical protein